MFEDLDGNLTGGSIRLIGIGGQITGFDADWIIVDDLVKGVQDTTPQYWIRLRSSLMVL